MGRSVVLRTVAVRVAFWSQSMIILLALLAPILNTAKAEAAAFVRAATPATATSNGANPTVTVNMGSAATSGNLLIVVCSVASSSLTNLTVAGYTPVSPLVVGAVTQGVYYKTASTNDTSATCAVSGRPRSAVTAQMYEYSGLTATPHDVVSASSGTTAAVSSGTATPTTSQSLVFTAISALSGTAYTNQTAGYTKRTDSLTGLHIGQADLFTSSTAPQAFTATNSTASAWRGQIVIFKAIPPPAVLAADIVDANNISIASPTLSFPARAPSFSCETNTTVLGTAAQKIRITNMTLSPSWELSIAPTAGPTATWSSGAANYDVNDPNNNGCTDGDDIDTVAGQMTIDPAAAAITPSAGCTSSGISTGSSTALNQGVSDFATLITATSSTSTKCSWDITNIFIYQKIPPEQAEGTYSLSLTMTLVAK